MLFCAFLTLAESSILLFSIDQEHIIVKKNALLKSKRLVEIDLKMINCFSFSRNGRRFDLIAELKDSQKIAVLRFPYLYKTEREMEELKERFNFFLRKRD